MNSWFYESLYRDLRLGLKVKRSLFSQRTPYQDLKILDTHRFGKTLVLDGIIQTTEKDEYIYHETLTHIPLLCHPNPKNVLIIGGGDGGILREVLKHPVKKVCMVEIDGAVIDASKRFLKSICAGAFNDKRTELIVDDGAKFIENTKVKFDVIIIDSSDPIGPAAVLFTTKFYRGLLNVMRDNGIIARQVGSSFLQPDEMPYSFKRAKSLFKFVVPYLISVPTYIGSHFNLLFVSNKIDPLKAPLARIRRGYKLLKPKTKYYNPEVHMASFAIPNFIRGTLR
ncbi:MAG: spermidine synthase [Candidatus Omnitrophica bacterium CG1_02_49_10]|nr:MAG: spermidine synthase [Candidatus Omnitrophica bacterium CG1_02_49_10]